jgi:hypothetical protein
MSKIILPNREQRRAMDKLLDRDLPREERIKKAKERNKEIAVTKMQGFAAKDWDKSVKKYTPKWAVWIARHIPPRKLVVKASLILGACPLTIIGGLLHWSLARMQKMQRVPRWVKRIWAISVVLLSFPTNALACLLCVLRFPVRFMLLAPILWFQDHMIRFGVSFKIFEVEEAGMASMVVSKFRIHIDDDGYRKRLAFREEMETFFYKI